jgi:hypothetical protein
MAEAIKGDPEKDKVVAEAMLQLQRVLCTGGSVDPNMFRNLDQKILRDLARLTGHINSEALYWCDVRNEQ